MRTRYEVRNARGRLCGLLSYDLDGHSELRITYMPPLTLGAVLGGGRMNDRAESTIPVRDMVLRLTYDFTNRGTPMPTLVIAQGKQAWLKGHPGFSRV